MWFWSWKCHCQARITLNFLCKGYMRGRGTWWQRKIWLGRFQSITKWTAIYNYIIVLATKSRWNIGKEIVSHTNYINFFLLMENGCTKWKILNSIFESLRWNFHATADINSNLMFKTKDTKFWNNNRKSVFNMDWNTTQESVC